MDPTLVRLIAFTAVPAGVVSLVATAWLWRASPGRRATPTSTPEAPRLLRTLTPLLLVGMVGTALFPVIHETGFPTFLPARAAGAIPYATVAAVAAACVWLIATAPALFRWAALVLALVIAAYLSLHQQLRADGGGAKWAAELAAYAALAGVGIPGFVFLAKRPGLAAALTLTVICFAASQVLMLGYHSIRHAIMAAALCALITGFTIATCWRPLAQLGAPAGLACGALLAVLLLQGAAFGQSDMPWQLVFAGMLAAAPWAAIGANAVAAKLRLRSDLHRGMLVVTAASVAALSPVIIAAVMYFRESPPIE